MERLNEIFGQMQMQLTDLTMQIEMISLENRAQAITNAVIDYMKNDSLKEMHNGTINEDIENTFVALCTVRIHSFFDSMESRAAVIPEDYLEDNEVTEKYDALLNAEMNQVINLCKQNLAVYFNDQQYLIKNLENIRTGASNMMVAKEELGRCIYNKEIVKSRIIRPDASTTSKILQAN